MTWKEFKNIIDKKLKEQNLSEDFDLNKIDMIVGHVRNEQDILVEFISSVGINIV